jgi:hypothetical protein
MKAKRIYFAFSVLLIAALACNMPGSGQASPSDLAATITAQALTLSAPTATPTLPTNTPTPAFTATPSVPEVSVTSPTNCRTGPSTAYDMIFTMNPGQSAQIVGKNTPTNYWIINNPSGGTCWLWGQYAVVSGNTASLPEMQPPPVPTPAEPAAPKNFDGSGSCSSSGKLFFSNIHVSLTWTDVATNEDGYHIYRDDKLLATLSANSTNYADDTTISTGIFILGSTPPPPPTIKYGIEAFNSAGHSSRKEANVGCP